VNNELERPRKEWSFSNLKPYSGLLRNTEEICKISSWCEAAGARFEAQHRRLIPA
jgi:hypothetical protein